MLKLKLRSLIFVLGLLLLVAIPVFAQDEEYTLNLGKSDDLGSYLVGPNGMTLYIFTPDPLNKSVCTNKCAENWPPLTVDSADKVTADEEIPGTVGTTTRDDGTIQVTYNGLPLYYWVKDTKVGDTTGNRVGRVWWIVPPATASTVPSADLGPILAGPTGMTLYTFDKDTMDTSTCYDQCATNWPPLTVDSADALVGGVNWPGKWGTTERTDKTIQVTYNGWPLYYYKDDKAIGDVTGDGKGDVWHVVAPETVVKSNTADLGDFLVTADGRTLYTFKNDTAGVSACDADCAKNWPPFTVGEKTKLVDGTDVTGELATIARDDGSLQVTYKGMPLYLFKDDKLPGDTAGQDVGDVWYVAAP
jgi:predicted lipoprotein with Yx(FWY)xxD motif